jgi:hypothetical protein
MFKKACFLAMAITLFSISSVFPQNSIKWQAWSVHIQTIEVTSWPTINFMFKEEVNGIPAGSWFYYNLGNVVSPDCMKAQYTLLLTAMSSGMAINAFGIDHATFPNQAVGYLHLVSE